SWQGRGQRVLERSVDRLLRFRDPGGSGERLIVSRGSRGGFGCRSRSHAQRPYGVLPWRSQHAEVVLPRVEHQVVETQTAGAPHLGLQLAGGVVETQPLDALAHDLEAIDLRLARDLELEVVFIREAQLATALTAVAQS